jgi:hypothetical protein
MEFRLITWPTYALLSIVISRPSNGVRGKKRCRRRSFKDLSKQLLIISNPKHVILFRLAGIRIPRTCHAASDHSGFARPRAVFLVGSGLQETCLPTLSLGTIQGVEPAATDGNNGLRRTTREPPRPEEQRSVVSSAREQRGAGREGKRGVVI